MNSDNPDTASKSSESPAFSRDGDCITLRMSIDDWENLLLILGFSAGAQLNAGDRLSFWRSLALANRLNAGNPDFTPYEIPLEYRQSGRDVETVQTPGGEG